MAAISGPKGVPGTFLHGVVQKLAHSQLTEATCVCLFPVPHVQGHHAGILILALVGKLTPGGLGRTTPRTFPVPTASFHTSSSRPLPPGISCGHYLPQSHTLLHKMVSAVNGSLPMSFCVPYTQNTNKNNKTKKKPYRVKESSLLQR